ncbi:RNA polymerase sigma-70 factor, ECF subfamily [Natronincola peptidivorans]|uniref:RNA polymerase sigma-70 factor, ECF subfamily n=1 Tax=Natronincola peptidivorans TaxID=426128 RepID=A0A1I0FRK2_9FIRM|nr:RNA polymerase sigma factor [Natronincola peptidivorans]SET61038.1 RNA polymerase sigma-70 factor, ECF subfamily [Natronincola peptidivorans]
MNEYDLDNSFVTGEEEALRCAIERYGQPLLRYCHNILCDYTEAQDAVQVTFIKAYNKRKSFKKGTSLSSWLYRIAYRTSIDMVRKRKRLFFIPKKQNKEEDQGCDFIAEDLKAALSSLSPEDRALVFSRAIDEKSYADLEDIYQVPTITLRKRYQRAKTKLAKILKENNSYYSRLEER